LSTSELLALRVAPLKGKWWDWSANHAAETPFKRIRREGPRVVERCVRVPNDFPVRGLCRSHFDDTGKIVMNPYVDQLDALGQEGRLEIFRLLVRAGPQGSCVDDIRRRVRMPGSTLSHHLDTLTRSGLLSARRDGRFIYYAVDWPETARLIRFLTEDCCADMHAHLGAPVSAAAQRKLPRPSGRGRRGQVTR
jgi:ArsR family transcriptional regulator, arsenate/arsenite/antimonite-responsive transcriptional repressor